jgi:hypothetical protein
VQEPEVEQQVQDNSVRVQTENTVDSDTFLVAKETTAAGKNADLDPVLTAAEETADLHTSNEIVQDSVQLDVNGDEQLAQLGNEHLGNQLGVQRPTAAADKTVAGKSIAFPLPLKPRKRKRAQNPAASRPEPPSQPIKRRRRRASEKIPAAKVPVEGGQREILAYLSPPVTGSERSSRRSRREPTVFCAFLTPETHRPLRAELSTKLRSILQRRADYVHITRDICHVILELDDACELIKPNHPDHQA